MRNQILHWAMFIIPWLSLFFMKKDEIKRYMPVALAAIITSILIYETGIAFRWWVIGEYAYPLHLMPFHIGLFPVLTMWVFRFTFRKFWIFLLVELALNIGFDFGFLGYFLPAMGILSFEEMSRPVAVCVTTAHGLLLYAYQLCRTASLSGPVRIAGEPSNSA